MRRFLGGIFGNTIASDISQSKASGVFDMNGQYYIKQEGGWLPPEPITATGGSKSTPGDGYIYHRFDTDGSFSVSNGEGDVQVLVVGGGCGGGIAGGGGGGGGMAYSPPTVGGVPFGTATYAVEVGAGGEGSGPGWAPDDGESGEDSSIAYADGTIYGRGGGRGTHARAGLAGG